MVLMHTDGFKAIQTDSHHSVCRHLWSTCPPVYTSCEAFCAEFIACLDHGGLDTTIGYASTFDTTRHMQASLCHMHGTKKTDLVTCRSAPHGELHVTKLESRQSHAQYSTCTLTQLRKSYM